MTADTPPAPPRPSAGDHHAPTRPTGDPCVACGAPVAGLHAAPGGPVRLCPSCAAEHDLGCP